MAGTLGTAILGNTLLDVLSTQNCNVATFGNQSSNLLIRLYDSNLPFANKNYVIGLCNIDTTYQSNAFYISANQKNLTRIGIGTAFPASTLEVEGVDALRVPYGTTSDRPSIPKKGQIRYNSDLEYFEGYGVGDTWNAIGSGGAGSGGGSTWSSITSNVPNFVLSSGAFTTNCNVALKRSGNNDIMVHMYINGVVVTKPTASADYKVNMPVDIDYASYPVPFVLGELWLITSNTSTGAIAEYKAVAKSIPGDASFVTLKYLNGTTEASFGDFNSGLNLSLQGFVTYKTSVIYNPPSYDSNNVLISGTTVTWVDSLYPYPYLSPPSGGSLTMAYRQGTYRYLGDDIIQNVFVQASLDTQPGDTSLNHTMPLQWPVNLVRYSSNAIVGDMWLKVTNGATSTNYKAYVQTNVAASNTVIVRYMNGTTDQSLATITAGSTITLQGTMTYKTTAASSLFIPTQYLPNKLYQDGLGRVAINNDGAVVRARWEVIETSNYPAVLIDQRSGADIAQFRSNTTDIKAIIDANGNVGIGTSQAALPITVYGNMMFNGTMYDVYGNPLWIPGSSVNWQTTPAIPTITIPTGGTWSQNNSLTSGLWRYIGNEVNYNIAVTGTMTVAPTSTVDNFKLTLPAPVKLSSYPTVPGSTMSNVILGELWANVMYGSNSNMFKSYAMVDPTNSNLVSLRLLSGTTDTSFSTMLAPSTLTLRGQINYTTTSNIMSIPVPSTSIPANFKQDQYGRVTLNTNNPARGQFDIVLNSNVPGLVVDQSGTGDIAQFMDAGVVKTVMDTNGNVGIGTTIAYRELVVQGNASVSGNVGIGTTVAYRELVVQGNVSVSGSVSAGNIGMFRNRIINGDMNIDQRNSGALMTNVSDGVYTLDRYYIGKSGTYTVNVQQVSTPGTLPGFKNCIKLTVGTQQASLSATHYSALGQIIEGSNISDFMYGTANAVTTTVSFWVYSSVTGTYSIRLRNSANDRSYVSEYTINNINTWEYKNITIPGDTTGTWLNTTGIGLGIIFCFGAGTTYQTTANSWQSGIYFATSSTSNFFANAVGSAIYITGLQLEKGTMATTFEFRPNAVELMLCQRYYQFVTTGYASGVTYSTTKATVVYNMYVPMRISPVETLPSAATVSIGVENVGNVAASIIGTSYKSIRTYALFATYTATGAAGNLAFLAGGTIPLSAEL